MFMTYHRRIKRRPLAVERYKVEQGDAGEVEEEDKLEQNMFQIS